MPDDKGEEVFPFIEGESVSLCPLNMEHINIYSKWINNPRNRKYEKNKFLRTVEEVRKLFEPKNEGVKEELFLEIWHNEDKKPIGYIGFSHIDWYTRSGNFYCLVGDTEYWGKNLVTDAGKLIVKYGFSELNLHKMTARILSTNLNFRKLVEKIGFKHQITLKKERYINGEYIDIEEYVIFKEDWEGSQ